MLKWERPTRAHDGGECAAVDDTGTFREAAGAARYRLACDKRERREGDRRSGQSTVRTGRTARRRMSGDDGLERLSSEQLHDLAVRRAKRHIDCRFFYDLMRLLPVAEAGAGDVEKSETDVLRLSAHVDDDGGFRPW